MKGDIEHSMWMFIIIMIIGIMLVLLFYYYGYNLIKTILQQRLLGQ